MNVYDLYGEIYELLLGYYDNKVEINIKSFTNYLHLINQNHHRTSTSKISIQYTYHDVNSAGMCALIIKFVSHSRYLVADMGRIILYFEYTNGRNAKIITVRSECSGYDKKKNNQNA